MTDTLMTPADSTTDAGASGAAPAPAAASAAPAPAAQPAAAQPAASAEGQGGDKPAGQGGGAADAGNAGEPDAKAPEAAKPADGEPLAPVEYTPFVTPTEVALPDTLVADLTAYAKGLNLPQDQAQALIDLGAKQFAEQTTANNTRIEAVRQSWVEAAQADTEFGGDKLTTSLPIAQKALKTFGSEKLTELLAGTGLGNHPEVIRFMFKVGQAIGEDGVVTGAGGSGSGPKDAARKLYPTMA